MTPERWRLTREILSGCLDRAPEARSSYLATACAGDPALQEEVESLLAAAVEADTFLERPPLQADPPASALGTSIGPIT